jgi:hypothetical protein
VDADLVGGDDEGLVLDRAVVADGQPRLGAVGEGRRDGLVARLLGLGLAVLDAVDDDVEHVDLAVDGLDLAVGADMDRGVRELVAALAALDDRAGDEVDPELARRVARPRDRRAVERLGAVAIVLGRSEHVELLRQDDQVGAVRGGRAREDVGRGEIAALVLGRVQLHDGSAHANRSSSV